MLFALIATSALGLVVGSFIAVDEALMPEWRRPRLLAGIGTALVCAAIFFMALGALIAR